ncbi:MAG: hypothetical protein ACRDZR_08915 [Acidimicrobiales bacterium]
MDGPVVGLVVADDRGEVDLGVVERALPAPLHLLFGGASFDHVALAPLEGGGPVVVDMAGRTGTSRELLDAVAKLGTSDFTVTLFSATQASAAASHRFEEVLSAVAPAGVPQPAWFAQVQRNAAERDRFLKELGALGSEQVAELSGSQAENRRATAHRWQESGRIFSVTHLGRAVFPGFQFDPDTGQPKPQVQSVLDALPPSLQGWQRALWWTTPSDLLAWRRPVDVLDESPDDVVVAARAEADDWRAAAGE